MVVFVGIFFLHENYSTSIMTSTLFDICWVFFFFLVRFILEWARRFSFDFLLLTIHTYKTQIQFGSTFCVLQSSLLFGTVEQDFISSGYYRISCDLLLLYLLFSLDGMFGHPVDFIDCNAIARFFFLCVCVSSSYVICERVRTFLYKLYMFIK